MPASAGTRRASSAHTPQKPSGGKAPTMSRTPSTLRSGGRRGSQSNYVAPRTNSKELMAEVQSATSSVFNPIRWDAQFASDHDATPPHEVPRPRGLPHPSPSPPRRQTTHAVSFVPSVEAIMADLRTKQERAQSSHAAASGVFDTLAFSVGRRQSHAAFHAATPVGTPTAASPLGDAMGVSFTGRAPTSRRGSTDVAALSGSMLSRPGSPTTPAAGGEHRGSVTGRIGFGRSKSNVNHQRMLLASKMRYAQLLEMNKLTNACVVIQRYFRANRDRLQLRRRSRAEANLRKCLNRIVLRFVLKLRAMRRRHVAEAEARERRRVAEDRASRTIQARARRFIAVCRLHRMRKAAAAAAACVMRDERLLYAVHMVETLWIRRVYEQACAGRRNAQSASDYLLFVKRVAHHTHMRAARRVHAANHDRHAHAAVVIQRCYRGHNARSRVRQYLFLRRQRLPPVADRRSGGPDMSLRTWLLTATAK